MTDGLTALHRNYGILHALASVESQNDPAAEAADLAMPMAGWELWLLKPTMMEVLILIKRARSRSG